MANPRETRGWAVVAFGGSVAYGAFVVRMWAIFAKPEWPVPVHESLLVLALSGVAIAAVGLREALWYFLVQADGMAMYGASLLLLGAGTFHLFQIPSERDPSFMLFLLAGAMLEWMAIPLLSYRSATALTIVGVGVLAIAGLTTGFAFLPAPFSSAVDPWTWIPLGARILGLAALGAIGNMLYLVKQVLPAVQRTGPPA